MVRWVENGRLEARERDILRKRRMIREYQLDVDSVKREEGAWNAMDGGVLELEGVG